MLLSAAVPVEGQRLVVPTYLHWLLIDILVHAAQVADDVGRLTQVELQWQHSQRSAG